MRFILEDQAGALRAEPGGLIQEMEDRHGGISRGGAARRDRSG